MRIVKFIITGLILLLLFSIISPIISIFFPGVKGAFLDVEKGALVNKTVNTLQNDSTVPMSKDTYLANQELQRKAKDVNKKSGWEHALGWIPWVGDHVENACQTSRNAELAKAQQDYEITKAADPIFQQAVGGEVSFDFKKIIIIVAVIAAILLVVFIVLKTKPKTKKLPGEGKKFKFPKFKLPKFGKKEKAPVIVANVQPQPALAATAPVASLAPLQGMAPLQAGSPLIQAPVAQTQLQQAAMQTYVPTQGPDGRTSTLEVDYESLLYRQCEYLGIDPRQAIADADGNIQKAWHTTWMMLPPEAKAEMDKQRSIASGNM